MSWHVRSVQFLLPVILLAGCATNDTYRPISDVVCVVKNEGDCASHSIQIHNTNDKIEENEYTLGFVEINDQGQFRDNRQQLNALIKALESTPKDEPLIISVFVHGWHHNAKEGDPNIESFKKSLAKLTDVYKPFSIKRKVFGVYVGWRGDSVNVDYLNELTFWDRKNTAENVGHVALTELLLRLEKVKNDRNIAEKERNAADKENTNTKSRNRLAIIGHSFGGAAVYQSTAQIIVSRFMLSGQNGDDNKTIKGIGDLVVLINPAFEAIRYAPLFDLAHAKCEYEQLQKPKLVILTSEKDSATKTLFPLGRFFSTLFEKHGEIKRNDCGLPITFSESKADKIAVGHFEPLITHELKLAANKPANSKLATKAAFKRVACDDWPPQKNGEPINLGSTDLVSLGKTVERNPYLNIKVDSKISADHNDIFGEELLDFIQVITFASTDPNCEPNSD